MLPAPPPGWLHVQVAGVGGVGGEGPGDGHVSDWNLQLVIVLVTGTPEICTSAGYLVVEFTPHVSPVTPCTTTELFIWPVWMFASALSFVKAAGFFVQVDLTVWATCFDWDFDWDQECEY